MDHVDDGQFRALPYAPERARATAREAAILVTEAVRFRVLGPLEVVDPDQGVIPLAGRRERQVLGTLCLQAGAVVAADDLTELIWGDALPRHPANALQARVSSIRRVIGHERVETVGQGYRIVAARGEIDLTLFEDLVDEAAALTERDPARAEILSSQALRLWRGPPLPEVDHPALVPTTSRATELRRRAVELRAWSLVDLGRAPEALPMLTEAVDEEPLDESLARAALVALDRSGRRAEALRVAQRHRHAVAEAGLETGRAFDATEHGVVSGHRPDGDLGRVPPPFYGDRFVGRRSQGEEVAASLEHHRLTCLVGTGGVGKSRLAREVALASARWWCDVTAALSDAEVASTLCSELRIRPDQGTSAEDALRRALASTSGVLVLDGCEHVLREVGRLASTLLASVDGLRLLVTSRTPLGVPGEHIIAVPPLPLDGEGSAQDLFRDRARLVAPTQPTDDPAVDAIVSELDGIPLAVELAASRLAVVDARELLEHLTGRIGELSTDLHARPLRHRSVEASIEASLSQLSDHLRDALLALAAFRGPFTVVDAAWMMDTDPAFGAAHVDALRLASLLQPAGGSPPELRVLGPIRDVVWASPRRAGETDGLVRRHRAWVAMRLEHARAAHRGPAEAAAVHELDRLRPEIASALARTEGDAREILAPLAELLAFRMSADDARTFGPSVVRVESPDPWVLAGGAQAAFAAGDLRGADDLCTWARSTQGGGRVPWLVDWVQGAISLFTGSFADARARYDQTRAVATDPWARAFFAAVAAHAAAYGGDHDAPDVARAAVLESEAIDNPSCQAWAACALALSVYDTEPRVAWDSLRDAERLAAAVSNQVVRDVVRQRRAELDGAASDSHIATVLQSLDEWERRGNRSHAAEVIARAMPALAERGAHRSLAVLHGAIDNAPGAELRLPGDQRRIQSAVEEAQASLGEDGFQQARRRGAGLPFDEALEFARHALRDVLPHR